MSEVNDTSFTFPHENRSDMDIVFNLTEFDPDSFLITIPPIRKVPKIFIQSLLALFVSGLFAFPTLLLVAWQIYKHLRHFTCPREQRWIVRILFIIPICTLDSWVNLFFFDNGGPCFYFNVVRDCYQAVVIYSFMNLCYEYLGGECCILAKIVNEPSRLKFYYFPCCLFGGLYAITFLRCCWQAVLQFCLVKSILAMLILIFKLCGLHKEGDFSVEGTYLYTTITCSISVAVSFYALLMFYAATRNLLTSRRPLLKFVAVMTVVFFIYFQGVILAILEREGVISSGYSEDGVMTYGSGRVLLAYQNFFVCVEMFFACILFDAAFSHVRYAPRDDNNSRSVAVQCMNNGPTNIEMIAKDSAMEQESLPSIYPEPLSHQENEDEVEGQEVESSGDRHAILSRRQSMHLTREPLPGGRVDKREVMGSVSKVEFDEEKLALISSDDEMP